MRILRNDKGSILVLVLIISVVFAVIVADLSSRFIRLTHSGAKYAMAAENLRAADELSKVVAKAYEVGIQTSGACYPGDEKVINGTVTFCFADSGSNARCVDSAYGNGKVCVDVTNSKALALNRADPFDEIAAARPRDMQTFSIQLDLIPTASAAGLTASTAMPDAPPNVIQNVVPPKTCDGSASDITACRLCGPGQPNICFQIGYCSADNPGCGVAEEIKIDMMVERPAGTAATPCASTAVSWTNAATCNQTLPVTPVGTSVSVTDSTNPTTGSANYQCLASGAWAATPTTSSCTTVPPTPAPTAAPTFCSLCSMTAAIRPSGFFGSGSACNAGNVATGPLGCNYGSYFRGNCGPTACVAPSPTPADKCWVKTAENTSPAWAWISAPPQCNQYGMCSNLNQSQSATCVEWADAGHTGTLLAPGYTVRCLDATSNTCVEAPSGALCNGVPKPAPLVTPSCIFPDTRKSCGGNSWHCNGSAWVWVQNDFCGDSNTRCP